MLPPVWEAAAESLGPVSVSVRRVVGLGGSRGAVLLGGLVDSRPGRVSLVDSRPSGDPSHMCDGSA